MHISALAEGHFLPSIRYFYALVCKSLALPRMHNQPEVAGNSIGGHPVGADQSDSY